MATPQAMGAALYNPFLPVDMQTKLLQAQQQQAMAQALLAQGETPLDTKDRQIGGVGYAISPLEGLGKLAQTLSGAYQQKTANEKLVAALGGGSSKPTDPSAPVSPSGATSTPALAAAQGQSGMFGLPPDITRLAASMYGMEGGPRAVAELVGKFAAPTEQQKNFQGPAFQQWQQTQLYPGMNKFQEGLGTAAASNAPAGTMPQGLQPLPGGAQLPPTPPNPPNVDDTQASNAQLTNAATGALPPIASGALNPNAPPNQAMGASVNPLPNPMNVPAAFNATAMPAPVAGESNAQYNARLDAAKAGATAAGTKTGDNAAEASKTLTVMQSNLPMLLQRLQQMRDAAKTADFGFGVNEEGTGLQQEMHEYDPQKSAANNILLQRAAQGILPELGPSLAQAGIRGNKFLETIASTASGLNMAAHPEAKQKIIDGLESQYLNNFKSTATQVRSYGGQAPTDQEIDAQVAKLKMPSMANGRVKIITPDGKSGTIDPAHVQDLISAGGKLAQ